MEKESEACVTEWVQAKHNACTSRVECGRGKEAMHFIAASDRDEVSRGKKGERVTLSLRSNSGTDFRISN
jgi:hypothetical protein